MEGQIGQAIDILKKGGIVAFPTDTVYGLGANVYDEGAVLRVYEAKGRPRRLALPLLLADVSQIADVAQDVPEIAWRLAQRFLPGGLTLVLYKSPSVSSLVTGGGEKGSHLERVTPTLEDTQLEAEARPERDEKNEKIAVRVPAHPVPIALIEGLGAPIIGTSANLSGSPSPVTAEEVYRQMGGRVDLIIDGNCPGGTDSTVLDLTAEPPRILREGAISGDEIAQVCKVSFSAEEGR